MRAILVGAGGTTRALLRRLGESWEVTVIDTSAERLSQAKRLREFRAVQGDASSRLVLEEAGLDEADAVVAAANDDEVNLEVCRLSKEGGILRIAAMAADPERLADYRELDVPAFSPHSLTARRIELSLETRRIASRAFADGRAEAIELRVGHDSPVRGKALRDLRARSWLVGAILRGDSLIIPHGETILQADDLVTVVGSAEDFPEMVRTFTSGEPRFPLDFGKRVAVALRTQNDVGGALAEAIYVQRTSQATSVVVVYRSAHAEDGEELVEGAREAAAGLELEFRPVQGRPTRALEEIAAEENVGVLVMPATETAAAWWRLKTNQAVSLCRKTSVPVLVSRRGPPYRRILVPARRTVSGRAAARVAIDLAREAEAELVGMAVFDPSFIAGPGAIEEARGAVGFLQEEAAVQGVDVVGRIRQGNPVHEFLRATEGVDLLVVGVNQQRRLFQVRVADHLADRTESSILLVPAVE
jgi:trk system potassium uptake protein TrkA